jgi:hypothetical protein
MTSQIMEMKQGGKLYPKMQKLLFKVHFHFPFLIIINRLALQGSTSEIEHNRSFRT